MAILRKLPAAVAVAALTATLVGCGSNEVRDERDEARMERDAALAAQAAAEQARMEAEAAQAASDEAAAADDAARMQAEGERDALQAEEDRRAAERMAQDMADRMRMSRVLYEEALGESGSVATTLKGYAAPDSTTRTVDISGCGVGRDGDTPPCRYIDNLMVDVDGIKWTERAEADPVDTSELKLIETTLSRTMTPATMMGSWTGAEYRRVGYKEGANPVSVVDVTDTAMVYTNQGAPTVESKPFAEKHEFSNMGPFLDSTVLANNMEYVASPVFAVESGAIAHEANREGAMPFFETRGTYDGAPGTYRCALPSDAAATTVCASKVVAGGVELAFLNSSNHVLLGAGIHNTAWTFIPDAGAMTHRETADDKYGVYGWWLREDVDTGTMVGTFFETSGEVALSALYNQATPAIGRVAGPATYVGHAAGQYALLPGLANPTGDAGPFTANVMLKAEFLGTTGPALTAGYLSGTVDGFMGADGMPRDWTVEFTRTPISADNTGPELSGWGRVYPGFTDARTVDPARPATFGQQTLPTTWTINGVPANPAGEWKARLYDEDEGYVPQFALGDFTAEHGAAIGRMVGAFGAEIQPEESQAESQ